MLLTRRTSRALHPTCRFFTTSCSRLSEQARGTIREGDVVILRRTDAPDAPATLTKPLRAGWKVQSHRGDFEHSEIIGKEARDVVRSTANKPARIHIPTLAEYVTMTPRIVTPVYPGEANTIVSLLDIHVSPPPINLPDEEPLLELLEAGTGHGSLTLHLARAIHGANLAQPPDVPVVERSEESPSDGLQNPNIETRAAWRRSRRAILHTLDVSEHHSNHARKVVKGFRRGMYAGSVDFHVGDLSTFVEGELDRRGTGEPFLSYVILDLPATEDHLGTVAKAMKDDAILTVFCPSVTQIAECVAHVKKHALPFFLEQVVELGANFSAGRPWEVRVVKPRTVQRIENEHVDSSPAPELSGADAVEKDKQGVIDTVLQSVKQSVNKIAESGPSDGGNNWKTICRPEFGGRVTGGGFLGLWRRTKDFKS